MKKEAKAHRLSKDLFSWTGLGQARLAPNCGSSWNFVHTGSRN